MCLTVVLVVVLPFVLGFGLRVVLLSLCMFPFFVTDHFSVTVTVMRGCGCLCCVWLSRLLVFVVLRFFGVVFAFVLAAEFCHCCCYRDCFCCCSGGG